MDVDVPIELGAEDAVAQESAAVCLVDGALEDTLHVEELAADVDVRDLGAYRKAGNRAALDQQMRVALHDQMVLERARLALVRVAGEVTGLAGLLVDKLPLHPGREAGAAPATRTRAPDQRE